MRAYQMNGNKYTKNTKYGNKEMQERTKVIPMRRMSRKQKVAEKIWQGVQKGKSMLYLRAMRQQAGIDGILVTVGLCIIALLLCVVMKDSMTSFIQTIVQAMQTKANGILTGV